MQVNQNPAAETKRTRHYIRARSAKVPLLLLWDFCVCYRFLKLLRLLKLLRFLECTYRR